jgi:hypothetical protein
MTVATFGDFAGLGSAHLAAAAALPGRSLHGGPAAAREASRLAMTLSRYLAGIVSSDEIEAIADGQLEGWARAAVDAREALQLAATSLRPAAAAEPASPGTGPADPLAAHLAAAAESLAAGRDLLHTHFLTGTSGRSLWSAVITSLPVTRALLDEVARWSQQLAFLTGRLSLVPAGDAAGPAFMPQGMASACHWLLAATAVIEAGTQGIPLDAGNTGLLMAIPVNTIPPRRAPAGPETAAVLCQGIEGSALRLRAITFQAPDRAAWSPAFTADSWRWTATAAAVTCHISDGMLRSLAGWARQDAGQPEAAMQLGAAAEAMARACARWREAAAAWNGMTTETAGLIGPGVADPGDIVMRAGRLAFTDPQWAPDRARRTALRDQDQLAPDARQARAIAGAIHQAADALAHMADADLRAVGAAVHAERLYMRTRDLPAEYDVPYRYGHATPADTRDLVQAYQAAATAAAAAAAALDEAAITLNTPSQILAAARSAVHRTLDTSAGRDAAQRAAAPGLAPSSARTAENAPEPGPVEHALRRLGTADPIRLLRAMAIDKATRTLIAEARATAQEKARREREHSHEQNAAPSTPARLAASSFPSTPTAATPAAGQNGIPAQPLRPRSSWRRPLPDGYPGRG